MTSCFTYNNLFALALLPRATHQLRDMTHTAVYSLVPCGLTPHSSSTITLEHALTHFFSSKHHDDASVNHTQLDSQLPIQFSASATPNHYHQSNFRLLYPRTTTNNPTSLKLIPRVIRVTTKPPSQSSLDIYPSVMPPPVHASGSTCPVSLCRLIPIRRTNCSTDISTRHFERTALRIRISELAIIYP